MAVPRKAFKAFRKHDLKMSQKKLGVAIGTTGLCGPVSHHAVSAWECGLRGISQVHRRAILILAQRAGLAMTMADIDAMIKESDPLDEATTPNITMAVPVNRLPWRGFLGLCGASALYPPLQ